MPRTSRPVTVTLGDLQSRVDERVRSGAYASVSEVLREAVRALDREDAALDEIIRQRIQLALDDPRPSSSVDEVMERLWARHAERFGEHKG